MPKLQLVSESFHNYNSQVSSSTLDSTNEIYRNENSYVALEQNEITSVRLELETPCFGGPRTLLKPAKLVARTLKPISKKPSKKHMLPSLNPNSEPIFINEK